MATFDLNAWETQGGGETTSSLADWEASGEPAEPRDAFSGMGAIGDLGRQTLRRAVPFSTKEFTERATKAADELDEFDRNPPEQETSIDEQGIPRYGRFDQRLGHWVNPKPPGLRQTIKDREYADLKKKHPDLDRADFDAAFDKEVGHIRYGREVEAAKQRYLAGQDENDGLIAPLRRIPILGRAIKAVEGVDTTAEAVGRRLGRQEEWAKKPIVGIKWGDYGPQLYGKGPEIIADMPGFAAEFALTGGTAGLAGNGLGAGAAWLMGPQAAKSVAGRLAIGGSRFLGTAAVLPALNPALVAENTAKFFTGQEHLAQDDVGNLRVITDGASASLANAAAAGYFDTMIELGTELAGGVVSRGAFRTVIANLPKGIRGSAMKMGLVRRIAGARGIQPGTLSATLQKGGFHGMTGEMFEERVADVARGLTGLSDDFGPLQQLFSEDPKVRAAAAEQLAAEGIAFAIPGVVMNRLGGDHPVKLSEAKVMELYRDGPLGQRADLIDQRLQGSPGSWADMEATQAAVEAQRATAGDGSVLDVQAPKVDLDQPADLLDLAGDQQTQAQETILGGVDQGAATPTGMADLTATDRQPPTTEQPNRTLSETQPIEAEDVADVRSAESRTNERTNAKETVYQPAADELVGSGGQEQMLQAQDEIRNRRLGHRVSAGQETMDTPAQQIEQPVPATSQKRRLGRQAGAAIEAMRKNTHEVQAKPVAQAAPPPQAERKPIVDAYHAALEAQGEAISPPGESQAIPAKKSFRTARKPSAAAAAAGDPAKVEANHARIAELLAENDYPNTTPGLTKFAEKKARKMLKGRRRGNIDEFTSAAGEALVKAAAAYNPDNAKGTSFKAYADVAMRTAIDQALRGEAGGVIHIPNTQAKDPPVRSLRKPLESTKDRADALSMDAGVLLPGANLDPALRQRTDVVPGQVDMPQEVRERISKAHGLQRQGWKEWIKELAAEKWRQMTRAQQHIPNTKKFAPYNEHFRLLKVQGDLAAEDAARDVAKILDPLGPQQKAVFNLSIMIENQMASLDRGEPLRFGFQSREQVDAVKQQLDALVAQTPEIQEALKTREKIVEAQVEELINADLLPVAARTRAKTYYHQQVLAYKQMQAYRPGGGAGHAKGGFQKERVKGMDSLPELYDYNTDYIEAEVSWLTDAKLAIAREKWLASLASIDNFKAKLEKKAREQDRNWKDLIQDEPGVVAWVPPPGNSFFRTLTPGETVLEEALKGQLADFSDYDAKVATAIGWQTAELVLPIEVAKQLDSMQKPPLAGKAGEIAAELMKWWKTLMLFRPKNFLKYMGTNWASDIEVTGSAAPMVVRYTGNAFSQLKDYYSGNMIDMPPKLKAARNHGVFGAAMNASEIPDIKDLAILKQLYDPELNRRGLGRKAAYAIPDAAAAYFDKAKQLNEFRESGLRYASFLYYLDKLESDTLTHYGGSKKEVVDGLRESMGDTVAAAHLSRNLVGDYGNLSEFGNFMRKHVYPFWSYVEINFGRQYRQAINAIEWAKAVSGGSGAKRTALTAGIFGVKASTLAALGIMKMGWLLGAAWLWNHLARPDDEEQLSEQDQLSPHVVLGKNSDGTINVFNRMSSLGDFFQWTGFSQLARLVPKAADEKVGWDRVAKETAKAPVNQFIQGFRPDVKVMFEVATGQSLFPDAFNPRPRDRGELAVGGALGLRDEFNWLVYGKGKKTYWSEMAAMRVVDPERAALFDMYDAKDNFLEKKGSPRGGQYPKSKFTNLREAAVSDDYEAFKRAKKNVIEEHGKDADLAGYVKKLDPLTGIKQDWQKEFTEKYLDDEQRKKLNVARQYSQKLGERMTTWWNRTD